MGHIRLIHAAEIVNFITDLTQREGRIRYRIRLHLMGGETLVFADYARFEQYRRAWSHLHQAKETKSDLKVRQQ
jgi:hypothetical protein